MKNPVAVAELLIRKPAAEIYRAFVEPEQLAKFWLARASGPLEAGKTVEWDFLVEGAYAEATATELLPGEKLAWKWNDGSRVEIFLVEIEHGTVVRVENSGFAGSEEEAMATAVESTQGFTIVLCDLKLLLETGTSPGLTREKAKLIELGMAGEVGEEDE